MIMKNDDALTGASPTAQRLYRRLLETLREIGPFREEIKKTSVHLVSRSAFVGVRFRRDHLDITIKSEKPLGSSRCTKSEAVSKNRCHNEVKLHEEKDFDEELLRWISTAYALCS
jgi:hypothetical protein